MTLAETIAEVTNLKVLEVYRESHALADARKLDEHLIDLGHKIIDAVDDLPEQDTPQPPGAVDEPAKPLHSQAPSTGGDLDTEQTLADRVNEFIESQSVNVYRAADLLNVPAVVLSVALTGGDLTDANRQRLERKLRWVGY